MSEPRIRTSITRLEPLESPDRDWYQCQACEHGRVGVCRDLMRGTLRPMREAACMRCGQRYWFTDQLHRGEPFAPEGPLQ